MVKDSNCKITEKKAPNKDSVDKKMAALVEVVYFWAFVCIKKHKRVLKSPKYNTGKIP